MHDSSSGMMKRDSMNRRIRYALVCIENAPSGLAIHDAERPCMYTSGTREMTYMLSHE